jgi:hypothetical protein
LKPATRSTPDPSVAIPLFGLTARVKHGRSPVPSQTLVSLRFTSDPSSPAAWPGDLLQGPSPGIEAAATPFEPEPTLILWKSLAGTLEIEVQPNQGAVELAISIERINDNATAEVTSRADSWARELGSGYAVTATLSAKTYAQLVAFARCVQAGPDERACLQRLGATTAAWQRTDPLTGSQAEAHASQPARGRQLFEYTTTADAATAGIYYAVSRWIGHDPSREFGAMGERASKSEPIVMFAGLGGLNKIALLDCQHRGQHRSERPSTAGAESASLEFYPCRDFARPSALTLERAQHFWAVYLEDGDAPFDTTIEAEFGATARNPDYEDFDARVTTTGAMETQAPRVVRIGFRRFRIRDAPSVAQVAFTRQGPNYGVRQWVRVYRQRSQWWMLPAATVFFPGIVAVRTNATLQPVYADGATEPFAVAIREDSRKRIMFAALALQLPQIRAKADDSGTWKRLWYNLLPDATLGLADLGMFFTGASWPIPVWRDRTYVTVGSTWIRQDVPKKPLVVGQRFPLGTDPEAVFDDDWNVALRIGVTIDLFKFRK